MNFPTDCKYTSDHEWVRVEGDVAVIGITEFAQSELGDLVFVDLPQPGKQVAPKDTLCVVESTKAASDVYAPISGTVREVNDELSADPGLINREPHAAGWIVKLENFSQSEIDALLSVDDYKKLLGK